MAEYELVREIQNLCRNNQMRDVFIEEVETDDPEAYVRKRLKDRTVELTTDVREDGSLTVYASSGGLTQKFIFTPCKETLQTRPGSGQTDRAAVFSGSGAANYSWAALPLLSWSCSLSAMRAMNSLFVGLPLVFDTV